MLFVKRIPGRDAYMPTRGSERSAGLDIRTPTPVHIAPGDRVLVKTGIRVALPSGYEAQIRPRSGLAYKHGVTVLNSPGTIDEDYRGELGVILINLGHTTWSAPAGAKIAQMVVAPVIYVEVMEEDRELDETSRGEGGFGSTGS